MKVPSFDLKAQNWRLREELMIAVEEVVLSGQFILGDVVATFEKELAGFCGVKHGIGVGNGSDALYIALEACGVGPGDEVITTPFTFFATAGSIARTGAVPVFADIDPVTFNIDPVEVEKKITSKTKAILPVHLYGQSADMDPLMDIARTHGLKVIEDAAQAIGATYNGHNVCGLGDAACISFFPTKNLGAFGDAGMIVTNNDEIADKSRMLRVHGSKKKYHHELLGINSRLDALQAKALSVKLRYLNEWTQNRRRVAERYTSGLSQTDAVKRGKLQLPQEVAGYRHVYHQYTITTQNRDGLKAYLAERGIASTVYYPVTLHLQRVFSGLNCKQGDFPRSEEAARTVLSLPMFPEIKDEQVDYVVEAVSEFEGFTH